MFRFPAHTTGLPSRCLKSIYPGSTIECADSVAGLSLMALDAKKEMAFRVSNDISEFSRRNLVNSSISSSCFFSPFNLEADTFPERIFEPSRLIDGERAISERADLGAAIRTLRGA